MDTAVARDQQIVRRQGHPGASQLGCQASMSASCDQLKGDHGKAQQKTLHVGFTRGPILGAGTMYSVQQFRSP